jgi:hypothetical protein
MQQSLCDNNMFLSINIAKRQRVKARQKAQKVQEYANKKDRIVG